MKTKKISLIVAFCLSFIIGKAQNDLTLYNMRFIPQVSYTNPAVMPMTKVNIGLPGISSIYANAANTGFVWKDFFQLGSDDSLTLDANNALGKLAKLNFALAHANVDLLHVGFRAGKNYFTINITEKGYGRFAYPKDLFSLVWKGNGHPDNLGRELDMSGIGIDAGAYHEFGFGWAREINEKLNIGGRLKYLHGVANVHTPNNNLKFLTATNGYDLTINSDWTINTSGIPQSDDSTYEFNASEDLFPGNHGFGIDLGATYQINDKFSVSASIVDLGFIRWKNNVENYTQTDANFTFSGLDVDFGQATDGNLDIDSITESLLDSLEGTFSIDTTNESYTSATFSRFHLAGNYYLNDNVDAGLLFTGAIYKGKFFPAVTASLNTRVNYWLSASLSYSYTNRSFSNLGLGFSINGGPVQLYVVSDNILAPLIPQSTKNVHIHAGINLTFGRPEKDRDGDGVMDKVDECPDTPGLVEFQGCPDSDGDQIPDKRDNCPDVPGVPELAGCPDMDGDGITDSADACPERAGLAEFDGCPDRDGDKIIDDKDDCPDEAGSLATNGCPDKDGDSVIDKEDLCPEKAGLPENKGCPDTDKDGLFDHEDDCPTEFGPKENKGCPYGDTDNDGLFDNEDRCPETAGPRENQGCPYGDADGDGVTDETDKCPQTPGPIDNEGCPVLEEEEQEIINTAFENLEFESGRAVIRGTSYESLDSLGSLLKRKPDWKLKIAGHTDDVGSAATNLLLSQKRAEAVKDFLMNRGIDESRFIVEWYGETKPLYPNNTVEGRQKNRRVEMEIIFE